MKHNVEWNGFTFKFETNIAYFNWREWSSVFWGQPLSQWEEHE